MFVISRSLLLSLLWRLFLDSSIQDGADCIAIPGYGICCRKDIMSTGGGIIIYCLDGIAVHHDATRDPTDLELMWFTITLQSRKLLIAGGCIQTAKC